MLMGVGLSEGDTAALFWGLACLGGSVGLAIFWTSHILRARNRRWL